MTATKSYSGLVRIEETQAPNGCWHLTSHDLPGLLLVGKDRDALYNDVPNVIRALFELNHSMAVNVMPLNPAQRRVFCARNRSSG